MDAFYSSLTRDDATPQRSASGRSAIRARTRRCCRGELQARSSRWCLACRQLVALGNALELVFGPPGSTVTAKCPKFQAIFFSKGITLYCRPASLLECAYLDVTATSRGYPDCNGRPTGKQGAIYGGDLALTPSAGISPVTSSSPSRIGLYAATPFRDHANQKAEPFVAILPSREIPLR